MKNTGSTLVSEAMSFDRFRSPAAMLVAANNHMGVHRMFKKLAGIVAVGALLSACSALDNLNTLQQTTPTGSAFSQALAKEYQKFAEFEAYEMKDWIDQNYFAKKGLRAAAGEVPPPEDPNMWDEPEDKLGLLNAARTRLVTALDNGGRDRFPAEAALAQAKYDCWVEQQEENHQPKDIEECQHEFIAAMEKLEGLMAPAPAPAPEPEPAPAPPARPEPVTFMIFFGFDSADLDDGAKTIAGLVAERAAEYDGPKISIVGHTDTSGSVDYNMALSARRADSVKSALEGLGVSGGISTDAVGEGNLMVETADGVKSPQNRRATITIE